MSFQHAHRLLRIFVSSEALAHSSLFAISLRILLLLVFINNYIKKEVTLNIPLIKHLSILLLWRFVNATEMVLGVGLEGDDPLVMSLIIKLLQNYL